MSWDDLNLLGYSVMSDTDKVSLNYSRTKKEYYDIIVYAISSILLTCFSFYSVYKTIIGYKWILVFITITLVLGALFQASKLYSLLKIRTGLIIQFDLNSKILSTKPGKFSVNEINVVTYTLCEQKLKIPSTNDIKHKLWIDIELIDSHQNAYLIHQINPNKILDKHVDLKRQDLLNDSKNVLKSFFDQTPFEIRYKGLTQCT